LIYPIRYYGDPILRRRANPVTTFDDRLTRLAADMFETMYAADGIGLAAPQIGVPLRLFVALEVAPDHEADETDEDASDEFSGQLGTDSTEPLTPAEKRKAWGVVREHVVVNPVMVERSGGQLGRDGCLSLPGLVVEDVPRALRVVMEYQDLEGGHHRLSAEGYFAHVLQHEFDHLDGVLFFDHLPAPRRERFMEEHRAQLAQWQRDSKALLKSLGEQHAPNRVG